MTYKNKFKCGTRIWRKLGWGGKAVYNEVYGAMSRDQANFVSTPRGKSFTVHLVAKKDWEVTCHNAACIAAWAADKAVERLAA